jgi:hypothetical protein
MPIDKKGNYFLYPESKGQKSQQKKLDAENAELVKKGKSDSKKLKSNNLSKEQMKAGMK